KATESMPPIAVIRKVADVCPAATFHRAIESPAPTASVLPSGLKARGSRSGTVPDCASTGGSVIVLAGIGSLGIKLPGKLPGTEGRGAAGSTVVRAGVVSWAP